MRLVITHVFSDCISYFVCKLKTNLKIIGTIKAINPKINEYNKCVFFTVI